ncbi:hypothetical protein TrRE_jg2361 [Triparma retinervis]|uniref:Uncharacterized protein n=1 Tax=Triparma retinervis TaxID=2557542 RepID=A0A9W6ZPR0_9STRA|nr:hypothetical protein TrRE_jg2361 [Triparma retinervis]
MKKPKRCDCEKTFDHLSNCGCSKQKENHNLLYLAFLELVFTAETFIRGFLMGFGLTIMSDILLQGKRKKEDLASAKEFGVQVGLGVGTFLVGASVLVPRSWRIAGMGLG